MRNASPATVDHSARTFGLGIRGWRMVLGLTAQQVAERAGITRPTLRKIESGDTSVRFDSVLSVARSLGLLDGLVDAVDPLRTDVGRARADQLGRRRAR